MIISKQMITNYCNVITSQNTSGPAALCWFYCHDLSVGIWFACTINLSFLSTLIQITVKKTR